MQKASCMDNRELPRMGGEAAAMTIMTSCELRVIKELSGNVEDKEAFDLRGGPWFIYLEVQMGQKQEALLEIMDLWM